MKSNSKLETAAAVATSIKQLSAACFRQDTVLVECKNASEHQALLALAKQALKDGYILQITEYTQSGCLDILLEFRRPHPDDGGVATEAMMVSTQALHMPAPGGHVQQDQAQGCASR